MKSGSVGAAELLPIPARYRFAAFTRFAEDGVASESLRARRSAAPIPHPSPPSGHPSQTLVSWRWGNAIFKLRSLHLRNNHFIYWLSLTTRWFVLDFIEPLSIRTPSFCEESMRLVRRYSAFMTAVRPSIRSSAWLHLRACGLLQRSKTPELGFMGPE